MDYIIDELDLIRATRGDWSAVQEEPTGRSLWRYVRGAGLVALYRELFAEVRAHGAVSLPYRCDTPTHRRCFRMTISPDNLPANWLSISHEALEEWARDEPFPVVGASRGQSLIQRCSVCNSFGCGSDWVDLITAAQAEVFLEDARPLRVVHAVCPSCRQRLQALRERLASGS